MKTQVWIHILLLLLTASAFGEDYRILYINSYHPGYPWSDTLQEGFVKTISDSKKPIHIFFEYMDSKRIDPAGNEGDFAIWMEKRYKGIKFDAVIAADNDAYDFVRLYRGILFPGIPVFFCGVNEFSTSQISGLKDITGIAENNSYIETLKLISRLQPEADTIIAITDRTESGQLDLTRLRRDLMLVVPSYNLVVLEEVPPAIMKETFQHHAPNRTAIIHISYFKDSDGHLYEMSDSIKMILRSTAIPVYSKSEVKIGTGLLGGAVSSAEHQGRLAGMMVLRYLAGTPMKEITLISVSPVKVIVDYKVLQQKRIPLSRVPSGTIILNRELITSQRTALGMALAVLALTLLILLIIYFIRKARELTQTLKSAETNFAQLIEELEDGVFFTGRDGTILMVNQALSTILGEDSPAAVMGRNFTDFLPDPTKTPVFESYSTAVSRGEVMDQDICIERKDGSRRWILIKPILTRKNGVITGAKGIISDITQRKDAEYHLTLQKNLGIGLNRATIPSDLFQAVSDFLQSLEGITSSGLYELTPEGDLNLVESRGIPSSAIPDIKLFKKDSFEVRLLMEGKSCFINLADTTEAELRKFPFSKDIKNLAIIPLVSEDRIIGALTVTADSAAHFSPSVKALIESASSQITDAFVRIRRDSEIRLNRSFLDSIIENLPLGLQIFDAEGKTIRYNKSRAAFLGMGESEQDIGIHKIKDDPFYGEVYRTGRLQSRELPMLIPDGSSQENKEDRTFFLKEYLFPIKNSEGIITAVVSLTQDITRSKHYEGLLEKAREEAELASRAKSEFLANMSHEIRTPLNAVIGYSELLSDLLENRKEAEFAEGILTSGRSLLTIINDILDLSKMEAGMMELHESPVSLSSLMRELEQIFGLKAADKNLRFRTAVDPVLPDALLLDEIRLRQVLINLIGNAIKFTRTGSVSVTVRGESASEPESVDLVFDIIDTGIGIPEKDQHRIFEAFRQTHRQDQMEYGGTGLGLTISRRLVSVMGGEIQLKSEPGKGSIFSVRLNDIPICQTRIQEQEKVQERSWRSIRFAEGRVLIVDDVESNREIIRESLIKAGLEVREAENGLIAEKMISDWRPDCILMDLRMPVRDGYETTRIFRADSRWVDLYIIALSASTSGKPMESGLFQKFLLKPVKMNDLMSLLAEILPQREDS